MLVGLAWALLAHAVLRVREDQRATIDVLGLRIEGARKLAASGRLERAMAQYEDVADRIRTIAGAGSQPPLVALLRAAEAGSKDAAARVEASRLAVALGESVDRALARPPDAKGIDREDIRAFGYTVAPFFALGSSPAAIVETESMARLDPARKARVRGDAETLLFARALVEARSGRRATPAIVGLGLAMGGDRSPWEALHAWIGDPSLAVEAPGAGEGRSSRASLLMGLLAEAQGRPAEALAWLRRADRLGPGRPGLAAAIARLCIATGKLDDARAFTQKAVESSRPLKAPEAQAPSRRAASPHSAGTERPRVHPALASSEPVAGGRPGMAGRRAMAPTEPKNARNVRLRVVMCGVRRADRRPRRETSQFLTGSQDRGVTERSQFRAEVAGPALHPGAVFPRVWWSS